MEAAATAPGADGREGAAGALLSMPPGSSLSVRYHSLFGSHDDVLLLEVDDKLLPDILDRRYPFPTFTSQRATPMHLQWARLAKIFDSNMERITRCFFLSWTRFLLVCWVTIRGQPDEEAVLCTTSTTYALKFVGTSNTVFLVPPGNATSKDQQKGCSGTSDSDNLAKLPHAVASVLKVASGNMELVQVAPRLDKLKSILRERPFRLDEDENAEEMDEGGTYNSGLYRWKDLVSVIQASDEELMAGLRSLFAVEINGYWRVVSESSMDDILRMLLNNCMIHGWKMDELKENEVLPILVSDGFPPTVARHCLATFGCKKEGGLEDCTWELDEKRVCLHFAKRALGEGKMKVEAFMEKWMSAIPYGMKGDLQMLEGEVLYETLGFETWIRAFSVSDLPSTPADRFAALFRERPKWTWKDLQPFVRDLRVPGLSSEALLIKYTRRTQPTADVEPIFSAR